MFFSCTKENTTNILEETSIAPEMMAFYQSDDYKNSLYVSYEINHDLSRITTYEDKKNNLKVPILNIVFEKNGKKIGVLHAVLMTDFTTNKVLPNNNNYAMILKDLSKYDFEKNEGVISMRDVNYDNEIFYNYNIKDKKIIEVEKRKIPRETLAKYGYISKEKLLAKFPEECSGGDDGNVSWGECYTCLRTVCTSDSQSGGCLEALLLTNFSGAIAGLGPIGDASFAVSCVIIASIY